MQKPDPILVVDRFPALLESLCTLLAGLSTQDWERPTALPGWNVKDIVQHILGDEVGYLSRQRDRYTPPQPPIHGWDDLVAFINRHNQQWVEATRRVSPRLLLDLLRETGQQVNAYFATLDPFALGAPVNWAGPDPAPVWLDLAREFTERWHHQQHIRDAVGQPGALEPYFLQPVLAAFVFAMPRAYQDVNAPDGTSITLTITGAAGATWSTVRERDGWQLYTGRPDHPQAEVVLPEDAAWRLFTRGLSPEQARSQAGLSGDAALAEKTLQMVSILA